MKKRRLFILTLLMSWVISGCVSVDSLPHESYVDDDGKRIHCTQRFPEWEFHVNKPVGVCDLRGEGGAVVCIAFIGASAVVSSSVYAVGNVLHWAEKDSECSAKAELVPLKPSARHAS